MDDTTDIADALVVQTAFAKSQRHGWKTVEQVKEYYFAAGLKRGQSEGLDAAARQLQALAATLERQGA